MIWKNFAIATRFIVTIVHTKTNYVFFIKLSFTLAKHIIKRYCRFPRLIIIQNTGILLIIINAFI